MNNGSPTFRFEHTLTDEECRKYISESDRRKLVRSFSMRKKATKVDDLTLKATATLYARQDRAGWHYSSYGTKNVVELEANLQILDIMTAEDYAVLQVSLSHEPIQNLAASSCYVDASEELKALLIEEHRKEILECMTNLRVQTEEHLKDAKSGVLKDEQRRREARLEQLKHLKSEGVDVLKALYKLLSDETAAPETLREEALKLMEQLIADNTEYSKGYEQAMRDARMNSQSCCGLPPFPFMMRG